MFYVKADSLDSNISADFSILSLEHPQLDRQNPVHGANSTARPGQRSHGVPLHSRSRCLVQAALAHVSIFPSRSTSPIRRRVTLGVINPLDFSLNYIGARSRFDIRTNMTRYGIGYHTVPTRISHHAQHRYNIALVYLKHFHQALSYSSHTAITEQQLRLTTLQDTNAVLA